MSPCATPHYGAVSYADTSMPLLIRERRRHRDKYGPAAMAIRVDYSKLQHNREELRPGLVLHQASAPLMAISVTA